MDELKQILSCIRLPLDRGDVDKLRRVLMGESHHLPQLWRRESSELHPLPCPMAIRNLGGQRCYQNASLQALRCLGVDDQVFNFPREFLGIIAFLKLIQAKENGTCIMMLVMSLFFQRLRHSVRLQGMAMCLFITLRGKTFESITDGCS